MHLSVHAYCGNNVYRILVPGMYILYWMDRAESGNLIRFWGVKSIGGWDLLVPDRMPSGFPPVFIEVTFESGAEKVGGRIWILVISGKFRWCRRRSRFERWTETSRHLSHGSRKRDLAKTVWPVVLTRLSRQGRGDKAVATMWLQCAQKGFDIANHVCR